MTARLNGRNGNDLRICDVTVDERRKIAQDPKASIEEYCCNFLEDFVFSPVFFALKMAEELKPVAFNVDPYQFELITTESDCEISDDIRPTAVASKVNERIGKLYW